MLSLRRGEHSSGHMDREIVWHTQNSHRMRVACRIPCSFVLLEQVLSYILRTWRTTDVNSKSKFRLECSTHHRTCTTLSDSCSCIRHSSYKLKLPSVTEVTSHRNSFQMSIVVTGDKVVGLHDSQYNCSQHA